MEFGYLRNILEDLISRFTQTSLPHTGYLKRELTHLPKLEKELIKKKIIGLNYDVGAAAVLNVLKETGILNVCDYLDNINDETELLQIITDIFDDAANSASLIEEILAENKYSSQVEEMMKIYIDDILENSEMIKVELITALEQNISEEAFSESVLPKYLNTLIHHPYERSSSLIDVLSNQKNCNDKFRNMRWMTQTFEKIMTTNGAATISQEIMNLLKSDDDYNWYFVLLAISFIKEDTEYYKELKKSQFKSFRMKSIETALYKSLIISRQLLHYSNSSGKGSAYKQYVKNNIGELNYTVKDKALFIELLEILQNIISYENDCDILAIHISVQVSAPSREYSRALEYKRLLQSRQSAIME